MEETKAISPENSQRERDPPDGRDGKMNWSFSSGAGSVYSALIW